MQTLFFSCLALCAVVLLGRRRRLDFFTIGFASTCVYYLPCFFGFTLDVNLVGPAAIASRPLEPELYGIVSALLVALCLGALMHDRMARTYPPKGVGEVAGSMSTAALWATGLAVVGFLGTVAGVGSQLMNPEKAELMELLDRWYPLWTTGALVGLLLGVLARCRLSVVVCGLLLLFDVFVGFRSSAALTVIGLFALLLGRAPRRLLGREGLGIVLLGLTVGGAFFVYKGFYIAIKRGAMDLVTERLVDPTYLAEVVLLSSEPFLITGNLNEVIRAEFTTDPGRYLDLSNAIVPFAPSLGAEVSSFTEEFQPALFPTREGGLASSFLAEAWSAGGVLAVGCVILLYVLGLGLGSRLLASPGRLSRALAVVLFPTWAFYIHRNDLLYQLILERRLLLVLVAAVGASALAYEALRRGARSQPAVAVGSAE